MPRKSNAFPGKLDVIKLQTKNANAEAWTNSQPELNPGNGSIVSARDIAPDAIPDYNDSARNERRSPLVDYLPQFSTVEGWFDGALPAFPNPFTLAAGHSAWFGLQSIQIPQDGAQELALYQIDVDLLPTDSDGTGGASSVAWGNTKGTGAAIVIGADLPIELGAWRGGAAMVPRVETSGAGILTSGKISRNVRVFSFPSGKYTDTTPQRNIKSISFAPGSWRFPRGSSLDVALVVRSTQAAGAGARILYGSAYVALTVFRTLSRADFSQ